MDLENSLMTLLKLRQKARSTDLDDEESGRLASLEQEVSRYSGMAVLDTLTRPGVASSIWHLIR